MGSMISKGHLAKVDSYIQKGIDGGNPLPSSPIYMSCIFYLIT